MMVRAVLANASTRCWIGVLIIVLWIIICNYTLLFQYSLIDPFGIDPGQHKYSRTFEYNRQIVGLNTDAGRLRALNSSGSSFSSDSGLTIVKAHACIRSKNSHQYLDELFRFHRSQGISSFTLIDGSDNYTSVNDPDVEYIFLGGNGVRKEKRNENYYLWECMTKAILKGNHYVLNIDDDEFFYNGLAAGKENENLMDVVKKELKNNWCLQIPVYFFGSIKSENSGYTTIDFCNRERDVFDQKALEEKGARWLSFHTYKSPMEKYQTINKIDRRARKAIFKVPQSIEGKAKLLGSLGNNIRSGALIHGYEMGCTETQQLRVGHFTRSDADIRKRVATFWKGVKGLEGRFSSNSKIEAYFRQRNRTEFFDQTLRDISNNIFY